MTANLPAVNSGNEVATTMGTSIFLDMKRFEDAWKVAGVLASSTMVPAHFQKSSANCVIALNLADRLRVDPFMMMQNMYVVHGRPGIEAKMAIALVEGAGRFSSIKYKLTGSGKTEKGVARPDECVAYATEIKTGEVIEGPSVTWEMAVAEGWTRPKGTEPSKWQTMPGIMFRYRSAMFFARVHAPGALLGLRTVDELEDSTVELRQESNGRYASDETTQIEPVDPKDPDRGPKGPTESKDEMLAKFHTTIPNGTGEDPLNAFLLLTAERNKTTVDAVKIEAAGNPAPFWKFFAAWNKQNTAKTNGAAKQPADSKKDLRFACASDATKFVTLAICKDCEDLEPKPGDLCPAFISQKP